MLTFAEFILMLFNFLLFFLFFCYCSFHCFLLVSLACLAGYCESVATTSVTASATTGTAKPQGFQSRSMDAASDDDSDDVFETQAQTHLGYRQQQQQHHLQQQQQQQPLYDYSQSEEDQEEPPRQQYQTRKQQQQNYQSTRVNSKQKQSSEEETEEEEEEPDRLSLLLAQSKFACNGKTTGLVRSLKKNRDQQIKKYPFNILYKKRRCLKGCLRLQHIRWR